MSKIQRLHWGRVVLAGFLAELVGFVIVFLVLYLLGQRAFLVSIVITSTVMPFIFAIWVGRRIESRFVLHGALVGCLAILIYVAVSRGQPEPLLYKIAHALKIVGGMAGGFVASLRKRPTQEARLV